MKKNWKQVALVALSSVVAACGALTLSGLVDSPTFEAVQANMKNSQDLFKECREQVQKYGHNNKNVLKNYDTLAKTLQNAHSDKKISDKDLARILDAVEFAADKHQAQKRKDAEKTPYIAHPIGVTNNLVAVGGVYDADVIIGALLHDTVEDTQTSFEEIKLKFGAKVEGYVKETTDDKSLPQAERKLLQIVNAPHKSVGAAEIKLADKLYNLKDVYSNPPPNWSSKNCDHYFRWAQNVVDHLPHVNEPLKKAVDEVISKYWQKQQPPEGQTAAK